METQAAIVLNIDKICRVCLQEKEDAVSIFSFIFMQDISHRLSDVIIRISNMKIAANDGLPQIICKNCVATAYIANNFYLSCIRSSEILQEYLNKVNKECKQEPIEEVEEEEGEIDFILTNDCKEEIIDEEYACDSEIERNDNYDNIQCFSNHLNNNNTNKENSLDENFSIILNEIKTEGCRIRDVEINNLNPLNIFEDNQSDNGTHGLIINGEVNDNNNETNPKEKKLPHKKGSEIKDKMFECQYCYRSIKMRVFSLHMRRYHMNQKEIIDIYTLPRDSKERRREILRLREILGGKNSRRHVEAEDKIYKSCEIPNSKAVRNSSGYDVNKEIITPATMEEKQIEKFVAVPPKKKKVQNNNRLKKITGSRTVSSEAKQINKEASVKNNAIITGSWTVSSEAKQVKKQAVVINNAIIMKSRTVSVEAKQVNKQPPVRKNAIIMGSRTVSSEVKQVNMESPVTNNAIITGSGTVSSETKEVNKEASVANNTIITGSWTISSEAEQVKKQAPVRNNAIIEEGKPENPPNDFNDKQSESNPNEKSSDGFVKFYSCNICNRVYNAKNSLDIHIKTHSSSPEYKHKVCNISFHEHSISLKDRRRKLHVCNICGKKYAQSAGLTVHMRVHTGHRPYLCTVCGKNFRQPTSLKYHMLTHTKEKRYMCSVCGKTMMLQSHLVVHMRSHTGDRPYQCKDCPKNFTTSAALNRHSFIHTNLRPFKCSVCDKCFKSTSALKCHSKIHSDERKNICSICNKRFIHSGAMKNHMLTHTASNTQ